MDFISHGLECILYQHTSTSIDTRAVLCLFGCFGIDLLYWNCLDSYLGTVYYICPERIQEQHEIYNTS